jgi:isoquinoline 1-oxidoreductase subunit beta
MSHSIKLDRRQFVVGTTVSGMGLSLGFRLFVDDAIADASRAESEVNAWVVVKPDDTIIIRIARSEMGQGTLTGLAQLAAEELACDWSKVTTEFPTPGQNLKRNGVWRSFATGGSRGIRTSHEYVRQGGAAAREMLIAAAAARWQVTPEECRAAKSVITHGLSGRTLSYGDVANDAAELQPPGEILLKDPSEWTLIGKSVKRLDTRDKIDGKLQFGIDLKMDGLLNAAISACPVFGGKLKSYDEAEVLGRTGVKKVVRVGDDAVAVVADTWWRAKMALDELPIEWDEGPGKVLSSADIAVMLEDGLTAMDAFVGNKTGDIEPALASAAKTISADYAYPYLAHATMEPMNATALWTPQRCEVWCPTQNGEAALKAAAEASGLPIEHCDVHKVFLGTGFGRRGFSDFVTQAVLIAKQLPGIPVKLIWSREEDMTHDYYHPITQARLSGALDANGDLIGLRVRLSGQSILASMDPNILKTGDTIAFQGFLPDGDHALVYDVPNLLVEHAMRNPHIRPGFWRGVNINQNAIYLECFVDELAHAAGHDPLAFRQKLLAKNDKALGVLNAAAQRAGWSTPPVAGAGRGLSVCKTFGSFVAACAEVSVDNDGGLKIWRIVAATDPGYAVNPQQIEMQVEGSFVYGLSALLYGECTVKNGRIEQQNFDTYEVMRMKEMPEVETIVMPSGGFWGGVGEPTIAVAAPAVLNAVFAATGKRVRHFPLKSVDLRRS